MKKIIHRANHRGFADHGWLKANHSFSFANYHDDDKMHFGVLRVLNDDAIDAGRGFGRHPHKDMEIITLPLSGVLRHKDSMGNEGEIQKGEIQVMSAGTGIEHSEFNASKQEAVTLLQIWVIPREMGVTPRYEQMNIRENAITNNFQQIVSPNPENKSVWIHQDAWFYLGEFSEATLKNYSIKKSGNGVYVFVISGQASIDGEVLNSRDAMGIWDTDDFSLEISENSEILLMDITMQLP